MEEAWFVEGGQRGGQPNPLEGGLAQQEVVLQGGQGCPPLAPHAVFIAHPHGHPFGQQLAKAIEAGAWAGSGSHHGDLVGWPRRATEAHRPSAMKLRSMAERP